jgi:hypothetical protein
MRLILRVIAALGLLLFGGLFALTFGVPDALEKSARAFVQQQITTEIRQRFSESKLGAVAANAGALAERFGIDQDALRKDLQNRLPEYIDKAMAKLCGYDCERRKLLAISVTRGYVDRIRNLQIGRNTLGQIVQGHYLETVQQLRTDLRIFLGCNALLFLAILLVSWARPVATAHLLLPAGLLLLATLAASSIYLFGQNWFYTIVFNDYMGWSYAVYVGVIFGFLLDIMLNKARITTDLINQILLAIGSMVVVVPC